MTLQPIDGLTLRETSDAYLTEGIALPGIRPKQPDKKIGWETSYDTLNNVLGR